MSTKEGGSARFLKCPKKISEISLDPPPPFQKMSQKINCDWSFLSWENQCLYILQTCMMSVFLNTSEFINKCFLSTVFSTSFTTFVVNVDVLYYQTHSRVLKIVYFCNVKLHGKVVTPSRKFLQFKVIFPTFLGLAFLTVYIFNFYNFNLQNSTTVFFH